MGIETAAAGQLHPADFRDIQMVVSDFRRILVDGKRRLGLILAVESGKARALALEKLLVVRLDRLQRGAHNRY